MRILASFLFITASAFAQNLTEFGAVAAGSTVGGASGKAVSNGITAIFGKVDKQTANAAKDTKKKEKEPEAVAIKVAPRSYQGETGGVPLPPPASGGRMAPPSLPVAQFTAPQEVTRITPLAEVAPVLPPPPMMSLEEFRTVSNGMARADVLKFGAPSSKITMFEDGHLVELYSYRQNGQKFGGIRLTDGVMSSIQ